MKIKTKDLTGAALDWAVMKCEHPNNNSVPFFWELRHEQTIYEDGMKQRRTGRFRYSERWDQGGPIIEREHISIRAPESQTQWFARKAAEDTSWLQFGPTPLIAAMRCYVASKLGAEVEIPDELGGATC